MSIEQEVKPDWWKEFEHEIPKIDPFIEAALASGEHMIQGEVVARMMASGLWTDWAYADRALQAWFARHQDIAQNGEGEAAAQAIDDEMDALIEHIQDGNHLARETEVEKLIGYVYILRERIRKLEKEDVLRKTAKGRGFSDPVE